MVTAFWIGGSRVRSKKHQPRGSTTTVTIPAAEVSEGDLLIGVAYVDSLNARPGGLVSIKFRTSVGWESEFLVPGDMPVTVARKGT